MVQNVSIKVEPIIIVEGKYDKLKLENFVDGMIFATDGFGIFKNKDLQKNLCALSKQKGAIILTDSDRAGFIIRKFLHDILSSCQLYDLYIPDIYGKEKRKESLSAEGKLGVEGMNDEVLRKLLESFKSVVSEPKTPIKEIDLYECGLFGLPNSTASRREFQGWLGLPGRLNKNMLLKVLNSMFTKEQFIANWQQFINEKAPL